MEQWKAIPGYEGIYEASNLGRIRTTENKTTCNSKGIVRHWKQRVLKTKKQVGNKRPSGVEEERVILYKDGLPKTWKVAKLVALAWCEGYKPGLTVNHKDCDPTNNHASNLEWLTNLENVRHGIANGAFKNNYRPVAIMVDGSVKQFEMYKDAALELGLKPDQFYHLMRSERGRTKLGVVNQNE